MAVALTVFTFAPGLSLIGAQIGDIPNRQMDAWGLALVLAQCVPLVLRTRLPALCLLVVAVGFALHQILAYPQTFASIGLYLALYSIGAHQREYRRAIATMSAAAYWCMAMALHMAGSPNRTQDFLVYFLVLVAVWWAGTGVRRWRFDERERRRLDAELAASAERDRIARELHDVVTHHVTAMVVQADAAQFLVDGDPDRVTESLVTISTSGRRALKELRQLLNVLEATGESSEVGQKQIPSQVSDLVDEARVAGQPIEFVQTGSRRPQPTNVALAVHRVVQEALTNALKYAARQRTIVRIHHDVEHLEVEVTTAAASQDRSVVPSGGRGLRGLQERVRLLNGELEAGTQPDGGFTVRAVIPSGSVLDRQTNSRAGM